MTATRRFRPKSRKRLHEIEEPPVDAQIAAEFRMERGRDQVALSREDDPILVTGERRARAPGEQDGGGPEGDAVERRVQAIYVDVREVLPPAHRDRLAGFAVRLEGAGHRVDVFADVALDADDPDSHRVDLPRRAIKGWRTGRLTVLWIRVSVAPEQFLNDPRERLRVQQPEPRARDVA